LLYGKSSYKFTPKIYEENPELRGRVSVNEEKSIGSNIFDKLPEIFYDVKQQNRDQIQILGRKSGTRIFKWINKNYVENHPNLDKYKVILPATNGTGTFGETLSTPIIGEPFIGYTQTFISFGAFDNRLEAENVLKYIKTKFVRAMLGTMKVTQHNQTKEVWKNIPIQDFTTKSQINWSKSITEIDQQLYKKYNLNENEIRFIEENVKGME
ncbi:restriction endonuclease, partial [Enterococcus faecium]|nr:restriction endonuclease [Enterococcus faecium]